MTLARCLLILSFGVIAHAQTLRLHPANLRYYEYKGKPTVLVTSAEHYGAVLNLDFDYIKYLDTLAKDRLNLTRIFTGAYRESPGDFSIERNTLAPAEGRYATPWREVSPGKWDLSQWNDAYFTRLKSFVAEAAKRGIVVEVTLFTAYYDQRRWQECPLYPDRNVNATPAVPYTEGLTLKHPALVERETAMVRKIVTELNAFDNVLWEICNEPYFAGVALDWQAHIAKAIADTERNLPKRHLIAQNIANHEGVVERPDPNVSVFNFHYARPPIAVEQNWRLNKVIGYDESGFDGTNDSIYRIHGWDFILAGGAHYNNLDYSFVAGHEDGTFAPPATQPGYGSATLRRQLGHLLDLMNGVDFIRMTPAKEVIKAGVPDGASARVLAEPGKQYVLYLHHGRVMAGFRPSYIVDTRRKLAQLELELPAGAYIAEWLHPRTGKWEGRAEFEHSGGTRLFATPGYAEDLALRIKAR